MLLPLICSDGLQNLASPTEHRLILLASDFIQIFLSVPARSVSYVSSQRVIGLKSLPVTAKSCWPCAVAVGFHVLVSSTVGQICKYASGSGVGSAPLENA